MFLKLYEFGFCGKAKEMPSAEGLSESHIDQIPWLIIIITNNL